MRNLTPVNSTNLAGFGIMHAHPVQHHYVPPPPRHIVGWVIKGSGRSA
jgi:hypothetical protein